MPATETASRVRRVCHQRRPAALSRNLSRFSTTPRLARRARAHRSSSHQAIRRRDGPRRTADQPSSSANYLIDVDHAIIVDVEATTAIRQAEVTAAKRMIERSLDCFDLYPAKLIGDIAYGSAE